MHGDARCAEDQQHDHNELHAGLHAGEREDPRGVP